MNLTLKIKGIDSRTGSVVDENDHVWKMAQRPGRFGAVFTPQMIPSVTLFSEWRDNALILERVNDIIRYCELEKHGWK